MTDRLWEGRGGWRCADSLAQTKNLVSTANEIAF